MRTITENFNIILARQQSIGYDYYSILNPPASTDDIAKVEKRLDLRFSVELLELYAFANGTTPLIDRFKMIGLIPTYIFINLSDSEYFYQLYEEDFKKTDFAYAGNFTMWDNSFTPQRRLFPILGNSSGDYYWVDLNENAENYNKVYWTNKASGSPDYVFNSVTSMFQTIAESYINNVFSFTTGKWLDTDYKRWTKIGKQNNPGLSYWDEYISND
jgi:cell wall assembly regulator SMI1